MTQSIPGLSPLSISEIREAEEILATQRPIPTEETQRLRNCAQAGNEEMVRVWLAMENHPHVVRESQAQGRSALALAAAGGHADCVALLAPRATEEAIHDAIWMAAQGGRADCIRILAPAERHPSAAWCSLNAAAASGNAECLRLLLPAVWPDRVGMSAATALEHAASAGSVECLETLLPLARLGENSRPETLQLALDEALRSAAREGQIDCARFLLSARANPRARDSEGRTALWFAANGGLAGHLSLKSHGAHGAHAECARILAPVSDADAAPFCAEGFTPLWVALAAADASSTAVECVGHLAPFSDVSARRHASPGDPSQLISCVEFAELRVREMPGLPHRWSVFDSLASQLPLADLRALLARSEPARLPRAMAVAEAQGSCDLFAAPEISAPSSRALEERFFSFAAAPQRRERL